MDVGNAGERFQHCTAVQNGGGEQVEDHEKQVIEGAQQQRVVQCAGVSAQKKADQGGEGIHAHPRYRNGKAGKAAAAFRFLIGEIKAGGQAEQGEQPHIRSSAAHGCGAETVTPFMEQAPDHKDHHAQSSDGVFRQSACAAGQKPPGQQEQGEDEGHRQGKEEKEGHPAYCGSAAQLYGKETDQKKRAHVPADPVVPFQKTAVHQLQKQLIRFFLGIAFQLGQLIGVHVSARQIDQNLRSLLGDEGALSVFGLGFKPGSFATAAPIHLDPLLQSRIGKDHGESSCFRRAASWRIS